MSEAETNIMPMHHIHHWKPPQRPQPSPPSCFSELARLNQCYDDVQAMKQILAKVMADLMANDPATVQAIIDAIQSHTGSGPSVPIIGVTDGSDAQPGQVGEWLQYEQNPSYPAGPMTANVTMGVLQPGDWNCWLYFYPAAPGMTSVQLELNPIPPGFSNNMYSVGIVPAGEAFSMVGPVARALVSVPTLVAFTLITNNAGTGSAGTATVGFAARRVR